MKELRKKTYLTLFIILSLILLTVLVLVNVRSYIREREDVMINLDILENRNAFFGNRPGPWMNGPGGEGKPEEDPGKQDPDFRMPEEGMEGPRLKPRELENMIIPETELYTVAIKDGAIDGIFTFGNTSEDFRVSEVAEEILKQETGDSISIKNLYFSKYSYRYHYGESIVIMNNAQTSGKLRALLLETLLLFVIMEGVIVLITGQITKWIIKPAQEAFDRQKEFIADASHELKTPLAVIMASADEMQAQESDEKYLENIRYEADRMSRLIAGLLNLSKLENGEDVSARKEEDLSRILEKTCMAYEGVAFEQGVAIETEIEEKMTLNCNKEEMEQMMATILDNAVRHSHRDTTVSISAKYSKKTGGICIKVINSGDPIPEGDEEKIFQRFYRADKARSRSENRYGLGLAIARRIARNHHGDIRACSKDGKTTFQIDLKN